MTAIEWALLILISLSAFFCLIAGVGVIRMPDLLTRMSATTKAATLGIGLMLVAAGIYFGNYALILKLLAIAVFIVLTTPVAAHVIGRAAYFNGTPLWSGTLSDELRGHYDPKTHRCSSELIDASGRASSDKPQEG